MPAYKCICHSHGIVSYKMLKMGQKVSSWDFVTLRKCTINLKKCYPKIDSHEAIDLKKREHNTMAGGGVIRRS